MFVAQVGPLRFVEGFPHYSAAIFGCHYKLLLDESRYDLKYRLISEPIHLPTGTDTPLPIIRYASLAPPAKVNVSGTPCNRAYSRTVYGRTPRGNRLSATSLVLKSLE